MKRTPTGKVDKKAYADSAKKAIFDTVRVLEKYPPDQTISGTTENAYRQFLTITSDIPSTLFGGFPARRLIIEIMKSKGYAVNFHSLSAESVIPTPIDNNGFVSWLWVLEKTKTIRIVYNTDQIKQFVGLDTNTTDNSPQSNKLRLWADALLCKILFHELGHASLHMKEFRKRINSKDLTPSLDPSHEPEAWIYSTAIWGVLIGEHAHWSRTLEKVDNAWKFA